jgi:DNA helicase-2/ATP-dependent DNA helicase PcrA
VLKGLLESIKGPNIIIAGPGTGKTWTLVKKVSYLVNYLLKAKDYKSGIIISTFTNKATDELKNRIYAELENIDISKIRMEIGTIHSICLNLIKEFGDEKYSNFNLLDDEKQVLYIYKKLPNFNIEKSWNIAKELSELFSRITDLNISENELKNVVSEKLNRYLGLYNSYLNMLENDNLFDFSTIQKTFLNLINDKFFFENIKKFFNYFFIDEYQDVNNVQDKIFKKISEPDYNITIVGDQDQSIYGFRGSVATNLSELRNWFEKKNIQLKEFQLLKNYRSTNRIIDAINFLSNRKNYKIIGERKIIGEKPIMLHFKSDKSEARYIAAVIKRLLKKKFIGKLGDVAILLRSIRHSQEIQNQFFLSKIPFVVIGSNNLLNTILGKEFLALFDFFLSKESDEIKINNFREKIKELPNNVNTFYSSDEINKILKNFKKKKPKSQIQLVYNILSAGNFFERYHNLGENIGVLTKVASNYDEIFSNYSPYNFFSYLIAIKDELGQVFDEKIDTIKIMTIHQSKGLEFPVVFIPSQNLRLVKKTLTDELAEKTGYSEYLQNEEKRIFYVACTRAQNLLFLSHSIKYLENKKIYKPSNQFLKLENSSFAQKKFNSVQINTVTRKKLHPLILSFNKIKTYLTCPLQYKFRNIWYLETVKLGGMYFGNNVHKILEIILKRIKNGQTLNIKKIDNIVENNWNDTVFRSSAENLKFKDAAKKQILNAYNNFIIKFNKQNIFSIEESFHYQLNSEVIINGRYDLILKHPTSFEILDFKTGEENSKDYNFQLSFYKYCFNKKYKKEKTKLTIFFLKDSLCRSVDINETESIKNIINNTYQGINKNFFEAKPGKHCQDCAYNDICKYSLK